VPSQSKMMRCMWGYIGPTNLRRYPPAFLNDTKRLPTYLSP